MCDLNDFSPFDDMENLKTNFFHFLVINAIPLSLLGTKIDHFKVF